MDIASAAVRNAGGQFPMTVHQGIRSDDYRRLTIRSGAGLGGLVVKTGEPVRLPDYHHSALITPDYLEAVGVEGLHGIVCVPVLGPDGPAALLYAAVRTTGSPGDLAVTRLEGLAAEAGTALHHLAARASQAELAALRQRQAIAARLHDSIAQTLFSVGVLAHRSRGETDASGVPVWWSHRGLPRGLAPEVSELVIDGLREGLRNAVKHAKAEQVMATLRWGSSEVMLVLQMQWGEEADRRGIQRAGDERHPWSPGSGLGMLADRAAGLGGALELTVNPDPDGLVTVSYTHL